MVRAFTVEICSVQESFILSHLSTRGLSARPGMGSPRSSGLETISFRTCQVPGSGTRGEKERERERELQSDNFALQLLSDALGQLWNIRRPNRERLVAAPQRGAGGRLAQDHRPVGRAGELRGQPGQYSGGHQGHLCLHQKQTASSFPCSSGDDPGNI